jgi:hypothetical protein
LPFGGRASRSGGEILEGASWDRLRPHGNLRSNPNPSILYKIRVRDASGAWHLRKVGITSGRPSITGIFSRPQRQVRALERLYGRGNVEYLVHRRFANRAAALDYERAILDRYFSIHGHYPGQRLFFWGTGTPSGANLINR